MSDTISALIYTNGLWIEGIIGFDAKQSTRTAGRLRLLLSFLLAKQTSLNGFCYCPSATQCVFMCQQKLSETLKLSIIYIF